MTVTRRLYNVTVLAKAYREYADCAKWASRQPQEPGVSERLHIEAQEYRYVADQLNVVLGRDVR